MKKQNVILALLLVIGLMGCAQKYDHKAEKISEEAELRKVLSLALNEGKSVVFSKDSRRSIWISADKQKGFSFHQELPAIGPYVAQIIEPGTYYFAGGRVEVNNARLNGIDPTQATQKVASAGVAHVAHMMRDQRTAEYRYRTLPVYYGSSLGYNHGYWGGRRSHWGRRHYNAPYYGVGMHTQSERTVKEKVAVHSQTSLWANTFVVALPHDGRKSQAANAAPLVASFTVAPGEALLIDDIYISKVIADLPEEYTTATQGTQRQVLPASASASSSAHITDKAGAFPVTALEIRVVPQLKTGLPALGGISSPVRQERNLTRGVWLKEQAGSPETAIIITKQRKK